MASLPRKLKIKGGVKGVWNPASGILMTVGSHIIIKGGVKGVWNHASGILMTVGSPYKGRGQRGTYGSPISIHLKIARLDKLFWSFDFIPAIVLTKAMIPEPQSGYFDNCSLD